MRKMKDSGIEWIGEIPEEWNVRRNKTLFDCSKEIIGSKSESEQLLSLTTTGVKKKNRDVFTGKVPESFDTYQVVKPNDLVMCLFDLDCSAVFSGISSYGGMISPAYKILECKKEMLPKYADYWFKFIFDGRKFQTYAKNLRYTLTYGEFAVLPILLPKIDEQQKIADFLDKQCSELDTVIVKTRDSIAEYKKLKQAVITQAVTKGVRGERPMKDSGIEWIGDIPAEWNIVKLKHITEEIGDGLHSTPQYDIDGEYYFLNGNSIGKEHLVFKNDTDKLNELEYEKYKHPLLNSNTIMITLNGATYGKTSFYNNEKVLLGKSAGYLTLCPDVNRRFVRYYLQSDCAYKIMEISLCGTTIQNLSLNTLRNFPVPIPTSREVDDIIDYLDEKCIAIDALIAQKEQYIVELENYKKSLIYEYVTGKKEVQ